MAHFPDPPKGENSLTVVEAAEAGVRETWTAYRAASVKKIDAYLAFGRRLIIEKRSIPHGEWRAMLDRLGIHPRAARRAMQLARTGLKAVTVDRFGGIRATLSMGDTMLEIMRKTPELAEQLADIEIQLARVAAEQEEREQEHRRLVDEALAHCAHCREAIALDRRNRWTDEASLVDFESTLDAYEQHYNRVISS